ATHSPAVSSSLGLTNKDYVWHALISQGSGTSAGFLTRYIGDERNIERTSAPNSYAMDHNADGIVDLVSCRQLDGVGRQVRWAQGTGTGTFNARADVPNSPGDNTSCPYWVIDRAGRPE